jgi:ABC-2 type transport system ATP-binding protein
VTDHAIVTHDLTKTFLVPRRLTGRFAALRGLFDPVREKRTVVDRLTMSVPSGELVVLLGPNGAGKSTSIKMLCGILTPTSGEVLVNGRVPHQDRRANAQSIGAVFGQKTQLWWDLPARQSFDLLKDIYEIPDPLYRKQIAEFEARLDLSRFWDTPVRHLSLGQRVRCDVAASMLHDPPLVFLDEPTIGMDVVAKEQVREFLRSQVDEHGRTVLLTTHDMTEVDKLGERVLLIDNGRLMFDGGLAELKARFGGVPTIRVTFAEPVPGPLGVPAREVARQGLDVSLVPYPGVPVPDVVRTLMVEFAVTGIGIEETDLEDVMRAVYRTGSADPVRSA